MARPPRVNRRISLTPRTAKRITRAVLEVERGDRDTDAGHLRTPVGGDDLARGTFTGAWDKGTTKTVSDAALSGVTYEVKNYLAGLNPSGTMPCVIGYALGEWVLVGWDWTALSGYSGSAQQVLAHNASGRLVWLNTTACP